MSKTYGRETRKTRKGKEVPVVPPLPSGSPDLDPNPVVAICGKCGLELRAIMNFSCSKTGCPCFRKTFC